jgi:membrane protein
MEDAPPLGESPPPPPPPREERSARRGLRRSISRPEIVDATPEPDTGELLRLALRRTEGTSVGASLGRIQRKISQDRVLGMSAEAGFWQLVSLPSLLLAIFGALGYLGPILGHAELTHIHDDVIRAARDVLSPQTVNDDVAPFVNEVLNEGHAEVVSISFVISLWSGSSATACYVNTVTVAWGMRGLRSAVRSRVIALGLYLLSILGGIVILPALVLGPGFINDLAPQAIKHDVSAAIHLAYWPVLIVVLFLVLTTLYRLCLPRRVGWRHHMFGAVFAMLVCIGGSIAVRYYIAERLHSRTFDGALGAPLAALLFFYVTALGVLLGAELNAGLWRRWHRPEEGEEGRGVAPLPPFH